MIEVDKERFLNVFGQIFEGYRQRAGIFADHHADVVGPQRVYFPKGVMRGSADHLYWLTLVALSDKRTNSRVLYRNFARMFGRNPTLFIRGRYPNIAQMTRLFRRYQIALPVMEIAFFIERKKHLDVFFGGDPFKLYEEVRTINELMKKLRKIAREHGIKNLFPGAKAKIFSLLAMFLTEFVELEFEDTVPVDTWVQSISASTQVVRGDGHIGNQALERQLRPLLSQARRLHQETEGISNATWILGKYGCTHCHRLAMEGKCPIYNECKGPFRRALHPRSQKHLGVIRMPLDFKNKYK